MNGDTELLRRYVENHSEAAFAELVRLHLNLVYFAALRQVGGDTHRAQDVAQAVFTDLARKAPFLTGRATLTGWLHTSTRFAAAKVRRADFIRQQREQEATTMNVLLSDPDPAADWERLRPMIDDAIHELDERDREAVLLRYFENRPFAEIGATLRLSDDAARMCVDRALERLRGALARRGVKSTSAALATVFANQVAASAPAGLATTISGAALAGAVGVGGSAAVGAGIFMSTKTTIIISAMALAAIGAAYFQWSRAYRAESELAALTVDRDGLRGQLVAEQQRTARSSQAVTALRDEMAALKTKPVPPPAAPRVAPPVTAASITAEAAPGFEQVRRSSMNKAIMNNLRAIAAARDRFQREHGHPPTSLEELVGQGKYIPALVPVEGEDYSALPLNAGQPLAITNSEGVNVTFDPSAVVAPRPEPGPAEQRARARLEALKPAMAKAAEAYVAAHPGANPHSPEELLPYFATPQEGADFVEALAAMTAARGK